METRNDLSLTTQSPITVSVFSLLVQVTVLARRLYLVPLWMQMSQELGV
jgi:hypothetical protein